MHTPCEGPRDEMYLPSHLRTQEFGNSQGTNPENPLFREVEEKNVKTVSCLKGYIGNLSHE